jgi:hypothetical protein
MPPRPVDFDPEQPLRNAKHEHFARLRALLVPAHHAAKEAGYDQMTPGNAAKLDRRWDVRARITALSGMDQQMIREKRARLEARLMAVVESNILRDFAIIEMRDHDGRQVGEIVGIDWAAVQASDCSSIVSKFKFDPKTGRLVDFERDDVMNAISQLRDLYGFKAATVHKTMHTGAMSLEAMISSSFVVRERTDAPEPTVVITGIGRAPGDPTPREKQ